MRHDLIMRIASDGATAAISPANDPQKTRAPRQADTALNYRYERRSLVILSIVSQSSSLQQSGGTPLVDLELIANRVTSKLISGRVFILGITGSVAVGKSTVSAALKAFWDRNFRVEIVSTDGYLYPNVVLETLGLAARKGFPETYNMVALRKTGLDVRGGPVTVPGYSHLTYDVDPALNRTIDRPDILIIEGLGIAPTMTTPAWAPIFDILIYIDAAEEDLEVWFVERFLIWCDLARTDLSSFYVRFKDLSPSQAAAFAHTVWQRINLPNLQEHISRAKGVADTVLVKDRDHNLRLLP